MIKFLTKPEKSAQVIVDEMGAVYGDSRPVKTMIYKWHGLFKHGRNSTEDSRWITWKQMKNLHWKMLA